MAKKETKTNTVMTDTVNAFVSGLGEGRLRVVQELNQGKQVEMELVPNQAAGRIEAYIAENKKKVGHVMPADDRTFETLKSKEPATNTLMDSNELLKLVGNTTIPATAITATSVSIIKIRIDSKYLKASTETTTPVVEEPVEVKLDLSSFSKEDAAEVQKRIDYIRKECSFSPKVRKNIEVAFVNYMKSHKNIRPFNVCYINSYCTMDKMIRNVLSNNNIALIGPKGVGKNKAVEFLANFFDLRLFDMQMSRDVDKSDLCGEKSFVEDGKIEFVISSLIEAIINGAMINFDEINYGLASVIGSMNSLADHRRYMEIPGYGRITAHPQTILVLTMNKNTADEDYAGINDMNPAFMDRFHEIHLKGDPSMMKKVFLHEADITEDEAEKLSKYYKLIYSAVYSADADSCIPSIYLSQRKFIRAAKLHAQGFTDSIDEAFREEFIDTIDDDEVKGILENLILINC